MKISSRNNDIIGSVITAAIAFSLLEKRKAGIYLAGHLGIYAFNYWATPTINRFIQKNISTNQHIVALPNHVSFFAASCLVSTLLAGPIYALAGDNYSRALIYAAAGSSLNLLTVTTTEKEILSSKIIAPIIAGLTLYASNHFEPNTPVNAFAALGITTLCGIVCNIYDKPLSKESVREAAPISFKKSLYCLFALTATKWLCPHNEFDWKFIAALNLANVFARITGDTFLSMVSSKQSPEPETSQAIR